MIAKALKQLQKQRTKQQTELDRLDNAIKALRKLVGAGNTSAMGPKKRRKMSAAARKRIGAAQKARWAKVRAAKAKKK